MADDVIVMYLGRPVEIGPKDALFAAPRHPYTKALLSATPVADPRGEKRRIRLEGEMPSPIAIPPGCPFAPRCWKARDVCRGVRPELGPEHHRVACYFPEA
jgi:dipeptide transport system ATP-binding protein